MSVHDSPRLMADVGGTYARFALEIAPGEFAHTASLRCADHADFHAAVSAYLGTLPALRIGRKQERTPRQVCSLSSFIR